ncbi:hypothetical protein MRB53_012101 [Persea americana]|uniref:Uncharacterized protein n=1 Tax=Persea americana TaxID=3435 RepID=A0ACC2LWV8_PERAE|nr:hypothetical protein MRB53_012101 [Persea americana]
MAEIQVLPGAYTEDHHDADGTLFHCPHYGHVRSHRFISIRSSSTPRLGLSIRRVDSNCRRQAEGAREEKERERGKEEEEEAAAQHHCIGRPYGHSQWVWGESY